MNAARAIRQQVLLAAACAAALAGCASSGPTAPIETRGASEPEAPIGAPVRPAPEDSAQSAPAPSPAPADRQDVLALAAPAAPETPVRSSAVQSLFAAAMQSATRGDWDRAQAALERALRLAPEDADLWRELAYTQLRQGELAQAGHTAERALALVRARDGDTGPVRRLIASIDAARSAQGGD